MLSTIGGRPTVLDVYQGRPLTTVPESGCSGLAALGPAEDAVEVRAAHRTLGLRHPGALLVDVYFAGGLPLRLAFHAVELAAVRLRHDFSLLDVRPHAAHSCGTSRYVTDRSSGHLTPGDRHLDKRHTAWTPVTLRERTRSAGAPYKKRTKPPGTSGSLAFPCERADHLEVSCSERYSHQCAPSNDSKKATFQQMWTSVWTQCALFRVGLWIALVLDSNLGVGCVETSRTSGLLYFVWLCMRQSQPLIQALKGGRLSRAQVSSSHCSQLLIAGLVGKGHRDSATAAAAWPRG
jgi:hypothetical protein